MNNKLLEVQNITKQFPGIIANDNISFDLFEGEIHCLVGENGAGKSTLMKILYGLYKPDKGKIIIKNKEVNIKNPKDAINSGIGMVFQHFMLVQCFSVLENIILGYETHKYGILQNSKPIQKIEQIMKDNNLNVDLFAKIEDISVGLQQKVEIIKILYRGAEILIFDEPTAVLVPQEVQDFFKTLIELKKKGKGIIFITHKLDEVIQIADRITVIRKGKIISTFFNNNITKEYIAELMVGKPVLFNVSKQEVKFDKNILEIKNLSLKTKNKDILSNINFSIKAGEIYGIAGIEGNGQKELIEILSGMKENTGGEIILNNEDITKWNVRKKREHGISHIPEDRHKFGLLLPLSLAENCILGIHYKKPFINSLKFIDFTKIKEFAKKLITLFDIRTSNELKPVNTLSGGNQQKIIIARELSNKPILLLASQPTRGVDVGAIEFIHKEIIKARDSGKAILLISSDLDEILTLSDRIGVIYKGKIIKEFDKSEVSKEKLGYYMIGGNINEKNRNKN